MCAGIVFADIRADSEFEKRRSGIFIPVNAPQPQSDQNRQKPRPPADDGSRTNLHFHQALPRREIELVFEKIADFFNGLILVGAFDPEDGLAADSKPEGDQRQDAVKFGVLSV